MDAGRGGVVTQDGATQLAMEALAVAMKVAMPMLLAGLIVGLAVSIFQAATQIQEPTLSFIPKILAMGVVVAFAGPWMLDELVVWTRDLFTSIPSVAAR
jgi:flagellar biosynthetic protein FliQ